MEVDVVRQRHLRPSLFNARTFAAIGRTIWNNRESLQTGASRLYQMVVDLAGIAGKNAAPGSRVVAKKKKGKGAPAGTIGPPRSPERVSLLSRGAYGYHSQVGPMRWGSPVGQFTTGAAPDVGLGPGVRVVGSQLAGSYGPMAGGVVLLLMDSPSGGWQSAGTSYSLLTVNPDMIGGRLALMARTWGRFVFRYFKLTYLTACPAFQTAPNSFSLGYSEDPSLNSFAGNPTLITTMDLSPSAMLTMSDNGYIEWIYTGDEVFYTENDAVSDSSQRTTAQGRVYGVSDGSASTATLGRFVLSYVIDLYDPTMDYGFTVSLRDQNEEDRVNAFLRVLRSSPAATSPDATKFLPAAKR